jgi:tetratricopeptide (TPR) repeat protein
MKTACDYHPSKPATWNCPNCESVYCSDCIEKRVVSQYGKKHLFHFCPKCNIEAERFSFDNTVEPFWKRMHKFFGYPFHLRPLLLMTVISILMIMASGEGLFRSLLTFAFWGVILKYSFAALKTTAKGSSTPPKINLETISDGFDIVFKQIAVYVIMYFVFYQLSTSWLFFLAWPAYFFFLLSIPAIMIVLVCSNSLIGAINPLIFVTMAWRIGWGYLLMCLFVGFLGSAPEVLAGYVIVYLPALLQQFLIYMAINYYTIITYHLMGYVIFQYHEEIGYEVDLDDETDLTEASVPEQDAGNGLLRKVDILIKDGKIDDAIVFMEQETDGGISDINLAERYYNLLKLKQKNPEMVKQGRIYLDHLAKQGLKEKLCEVYSECVSRDANFTASPSAVFKTATSMIELGKPKEAVNVYQGFIKMNPKNPLLPKAYFLAANVINDQLKNPQKAVEILKGIMKKYPGHEILPYVRKYLGQIEA